LVRFANWCIKKISSSIPLATSILSFFISPPSLILFRITNLQPFSDTTAQLTPVHLMAIILQILKTVVLFWLRTVSKRKQGPTKLISPLSFLAI
jgi:hypothetical protein